MSNNNPRAQTLVLDIFLPSFPQHEREPVQISKWEGEMDAQARGREGWEVNNNRENPEQSDRLASKIAEMQYPATPTE